ncbi:hypothetical protein ACP70R_010407 [Stipagrostis hirtigluma subsp. patula]
MASFAAQIKDKFIGLVDRVAGFGRGGNGKDVQEPTKSVTVQRVEIRSRGAEPNENGGSTAGVNAARA